MTYSLSIPLAQRIEGFSALGIAITRLLSSDRFVDIAREAYLHNNWFTEPNVRLTLQEIAAQLTGKSLKQWLQPYHIIDHAPKTVGIIAAGNLPLVCFADILAVLITGHKAIVKLSSQDEVLPKMLKSELETVAPELAENLVFVDRLENFDAVIATGGNNSARYFHAYFGKYPHIIRRNRNSVAVLTGQETDEELVGLGQDVCLYFGLGCRSVSCLLVPEGFDIAPLAKAWLPYAYMVDHHKYANNLDYHKAIYLLNRDTFFDMGVVLLREENRLYSALAVLNMVYYKTEEVATHWLESHSDDIQVVVGSKKIWADALPFGEAQHPTLTDYADGVDTIAWLLQN
jgi:hypothetical protein